MFNGHSKIYHNPELGYDVTVFLSQYYNPFQIKIKKA